MADNAFSLILSKLYHLSVFQFFITHCVHAGVACRYLHFEWVIELNCLMSIGA